MVKKSSDDVVIDTCTHCRGLWFDAGEIDDLKDKWAPSELHGTDFVLWREQAVFEVSSDTLQCPRCSDSALAKITDKQTDTSAWLCTRCEGGWMAAEDFSGIVSALISELDKRTAADHLKASLKQASDLMTNKEDPIADWTNLKSVLRLLKLRLFVENPKLDAAMKAFRKSMPL